MLLPVLQFVSLWWTPDFAECHAERLAMEGYFHFGGYQILMIQLEKEP
jgi:hypothetical protein